MRIIQLSDPHIGHENEYPNKVDVRRNFVRCLQEINDEDKDALVLSGDLCLHNGDSDAYKWIHGRLQTIIPDCTIYFIPGNHDDTYKLAQEFHIEKYLVQEELYYKTMIGGREIIFLDTAIGRASDNQKKWLEQEIEKSIVNHLIIFMHHPPFLGGVPHMDHNYPLRDMDDFQAIFRRFPKMKFFVFTGHYHAEKSIIVDNVNLFIAPSSYMQIDQNSTSFKIDHYRPGFRIIDLDASNILMTTVKYPE